MDFSCLNLAKDLRRFRLFLSCFYGKESIWLLYSVFLFYALEASIMHVRNDTKCRRTWRVEHMKGESDLKNRKTLEGKKLAKAGNVKATASALLVLILLALPLALSFPGFQVAAEDTLASNLLALVNEARTNAGLQPVSFKEDMSSFVAVRAKEISSNFSHFKADGSSPFTGYPGTYMGENIQQNYARATVAELAQSVFDSFKASPSHWANIMNPDWVYMAVGFYQAPTYTSGPYAGYAPAYICQWFSD